MFSKHSTKFLDSEVMWEMEKAARERGEFAPTVNEAIRKINESKIPTGLEPSGNVFADLISLAAALREKGYTDEALDLENKIFIFKSAESDLYKETETGEELIEKAHPEGDVAICDPAKDDGHVVETIVSQHKKDVEVAQKAPKLTAAAKNLLVAVQDALGLKSVGQGAPDFLGLNKPQGQAPAAQPTKTVSEQLQATDQSPKNPVEIQAINQQHINDIVAKFNEQLDSAITKLNDSKVLFTKESLMIPAVQEALSKNKNTAAWMDSIKWAFRAGLLANPVAALSYALNKWGPEETKKIFSLPAAITLKAEEITADQKAAAEKKSAEISNSIQQQVDKLNNSYATAVRQAKAIAARAKDIVSKSGNFKIGLGLESYLPVSQFINNVDAAVTGEYQKIFQQLQVAKDFYASLGANDVVIGINDFQLFAGNSLKNAQGEVYRMMPGGAGQSIQVDDVRSAINSMAEASSIWNEKLKAFQEDLRPETKQIRADIEDNTTKAFNIIEALKRAAEGTPLAQVRDMLSAIDSDFSAIRSSADVAKIAANWNNLTKDYIKNMKSASVKTSNIVKSGGPKVPGSGKAPSSARPTGTQPMAQPSGTRQAPSDPEQTAAIDSVRAMQQSIMELSAFLKKLISRTSVEYQKDPNKGTEDSKFDKNIGETIKRWTYVLNTITRTGVGAHGTPDDGMWGPNTAKSLLAIKMFLGGDGIDETARWKGGKYADPQKTQTAAENNTNIVNTVHGSLGGTPATSAQQNVGKTLDGITNPPPDINNPTSPKNDGDTPVTSNDLENLSAFDALLRMLGVGEGSALSIGTYGYMLKWFSRRAMAKKDPAYISYLRNLQINFQRMLAKMQKDGEPVDTGSPIPEEYLVQFGTSPLKGRGDAAMGQGSRGGRDGNGDVSGARSAPEMEFPITGTTIDLPLLNEYTRGTFRLGEDNVSSPHIRLTQLSNLDPGSLIQMANTYVNTNLLPDSIYAGNPPLAALMKFLTNLDNAITFAHTKWRNAFADKGIKQPPGGDIVIKTIGYWHDNIAIMENALLTKRINMPGTSEIAGITNTGR